mgnify:FL=1
MDPYTLGALLGDGGLTCSIRLSTADLEILDRVRFSLPKSLSLRHVAKYDYSITGQGKNSYLNILRAQGLFGKKSQDKFVPQEYKLGSIQQRLDLLRGLMDTDGSVSGRTSKKMEFYSTSEQLAKDVVWLVESLGGKGKIRLKETTHLPCYVVNVISPHFNPFFLPRKAEQYFVHKHTANKIIDEIIPVEPEETICFSVASTTKSFIIQNQVVTHNTTVGAWWLRLLVNRHRSPDNNFLVTAPTYKIMNQSTLPSFLSVFKPLGEYIKNDAVFRIHNGPTIYFRTQTDPDSVVGITNVFGIWGDEAGKYTKYFWENIEGRAAFKSCPICLTTSPYSLNWIYKEIQLPFIEGKRKDICFITARSVENPFFPKAVWDKRKSTMDSRKFNAMYGGQFERMQGLVYDCFSEEENIVVKYLFPDGTRYYAGVDWGFNDPFVIVVRAVTPGGQHFQVSEYCKSRMTLPEMVQVAKTKKEIYNIEQFYCDPSQPGHIEEFNRNGIIARGANNDIDLGLDLHYSLIKSRRYKILKDTSPHTLDELETYHWPEPKYLTGDQSSKKTRPVDQNNHCLDANRYVTVMTKDVVKSRHLRVVCPDSNLPKIIVGPIKIGKKQRRTVRIIDESKAFL